MKRREFREMTRMVLCLLVIALACSALLGVVNAVTADRISENRAAVQKEAMEAVLPGAKTFRDISDRLTEEFREQHRIRGIWEAAGKGYVVAVAPKGFGGDIEMTVGVNGSGVITGVAITDHGETPGMGARADTPDFLSRFVGKRAGLTVVKGAAGENQISAITGATVTSRAVTAGALAAVKAVQAL